MGAKNMFNLYGGLENINKIKQRLEELKIKIQCHIKNQNEKDITPLINEYVNIKTYLYHALNEPQEVEEKDLKIEELKRRVNNLYANFIKYSDTPDSKFKNDFINNYGQKIFELMGADLIHKEYATLMARTPAEGLPDWEFQANKKKYYLECVTRSSCRINDYIKLNRKFYDYISVANTFYKINDTLKSSSPVHIQEWWYDSIIENNIWNDMDNLSKNIVWNKLGHKSPVPQNIAENDLKEFKAWVTCNCYMLVYFKELIPNNLLTGLEKVGLIDPNIFSDLNSIQYFRKYLLPRLVGQAVIDKLNKQYSREDIPIILFVSLSLFLDFQMISSPSNLINEIVSQLPDKINDLAIEDSERYKNAKKGIENLYAIIFDTTWYNWFPDLYGNGKRDSYYGIVYNTNLSEIIKEKSDKNLFASQVIFNKSKCFYII